MIIVPALPLAEQEAAQRLVVTISTVLHQISHFESAVELMEYCVSESSLIERPKQPAALGPEFYAWLKAKDRASDEMERWGKWRMLAARDAAITLYNLQEGKQAIGKIRGACPTVRSLSDQDAWNAVNQLFENDFKAVKGLRYAVAHAGELFSTKKKIDELSINTNRFVNSLAGDALMTSYGGKMLEIGINRHTLLKLEQFGQLIIDTFEPVSVRTKQIFRDNGYK